MSAGARPPSTPMEPSPSISNVPSAQQSTQTLVMNTLPDLQDVDVEKKSPTTFNYGDKNGTPSMKDEEIIWVDFDGPSDPTNPFNWPSSQKWISTIIVCVLTFFTAFCASSFSMGTESMATDLNAPRELATFAFSSFAVGFAVAPLATAPLSEAYGRYPMYCISGIVYVISFFPIVFAKNVSTVIFARVLGGLAASSGSTMAGGTISDVFETSERGSAMALYTFLNFAGKFRTYSPSAPFFH